MNQNTVLRIKNSGVRNQESPIAAYVLFLTLLAAVYCSPLAAYAEDNPLNKMLDETMSYFKPLTARVITAEDRKITVDIGAKAGARKGMRFQVLREEAPFIHPVTKEPFGKLEALVGKAEIKEVDADSSRAEIIEGSAREGDKIRISEIKVNVLFCQSKDTDWHLADSYYRMLKDSGRFNLIETGMDTDIPSKAVEEARRLRADVALLLVARKSDSGIVLTQSLLWVSDGTRLFEANVNIDAAFSKKLGTSDMFFKPHEQGALLQFEAPSGGKFICACDLDGKGKKQILLATGRDVRAYTLGGGLEPYSGGITIAGAAIHNLIWLDCVDVNKDGRDEVVVTTMASGTRAEDPEQLTANHGDKAVTSYIYELAGSEFVLLQKDSVFLRRMGRGLIGQEFSRYEGFFGDVFDVTWDGGYQRGKALPLPKGVNIYDFVYLEDSGEGRLVLAYDEAGFLNLYDRSGMRIWRSKTDNGGFINSFSKKASALVDKGEWSMKDRLSLIDNKVISIKRVPFVEMIKGIGFKKAEIKTLRWNGFSMDERTLIDNISGTLYDYAVDGDGIIVLASPLFGLKAGNILKGENPLKTELSVYKMKGN